MRYSFPHYELLCWFHGRAIFMNIQFRISTFQTSYTFRSSNTFEVQVQPASFFATQRRVFIRLRLHGLSIQDENMTSSSGLVSQPIVANVWVTPASPSWGGKLCVCLEVSLFQWLTERTTVKSNQRVVQSPSVFKFSDSSTARWKLSVRTLQKLKFIRLYSFVIIATPKKPAIFRSVPPRRAVIPTLCPLSPYPRGGELGEN